MKNMKILRVPTSEIKTLLKNDGCPAGNDKCRYLLGNKCVLHNPELHYRDIFKDNYMCGSCMFW